MFSMMAIKMTLPTRERLRENVAYFGADLRRQIETLILHRPGAGFELR
jgi:hypothetical protein